MGAPLQTAARDDRRLRDELIARWPELEDDERTLIDTLDGVSDFDAQVGVAIRMLDEAEMMAAGIKSRVAELTERRRRIEARQDAIRGAILTAMEMAGRKTVTLPEATISVRPTGPAVLVPDEAAVGPGAWWEPQPAKLSKAALKKALSDGVSVPGAWLSNGGSTLAIRRG